tara:strand:+ start:237 stop:494 length:258 start_codon:yes stop_codon:yes gene_type:complete
VVVRNPPESIGSGNSGGIYKLHKHRRIVITEDLETDEIFLNVFNPHDREPVIKASLSDDECLSKGAELIAKCHNRIRRNRKFEVD